MNKLSWFLYSIDLMSSLKEVIPILTLVFGFLYVLAFFITIAVTNARIRGTDDNLTCYGVTLSKLKTVIITLVTLTSLYCFIPKEKTMYLMLGSEVGEQLVKSETAKRVYDAVNKKLDEYLHEDTTIDN